MNSSAQVHELQVEVLARRRAGVGAEAEALLADVALRIGADDVHQEEVLPALLVVEVAEVAPQVEAVQVPDARHVAGADAEDGALGFPVGRLDLDVAVALAHLQQPLDVRQDEALGRVIRVRQMHLDPVAVLVGDQVEPGVAPAPGKRGEDLVALLRGAGPRSSARPRGPVSGPSCRLLFHADGDELDAVLRRAADLLLHLRARSRARTPPRCALRGVTRAAVTAEPPAACRRIFSPSRMPSCLASSGFISTKPSG